MRQESTEPTRGLLAIVDKWVRGPCEPSDCLRAIEQFLWAHRAEYIEPPTRRQSTAPATDEPGYRASIAQFPNMHLGLTLGGTLSGKS
jgi:hypothetical protein